MKWIKKGLIYCPNGEAEWAKHSALTPTPILLNDNVIRVYAGFRDSKGISRIGYVDVDAANPSKVLAVSKQPALDVGEAGMFDDNGVILGDVIAVDEKLYMYYIGFQLVEKAKFLAFTGLATSDDGGCSFKRIKKTPVMDRADEGSLFRAIHSVIFKKNLWKVWYATGSEWAWIKGVPYPSYNIRYFESADGISFSEQGHLCVDFMGQEYRIGRPRVYEIHDKYIMLYTKGTLQGDYFPGYAESYDCINWTRKDDSIGIELSIEGWDSTTLSYPTLLSYKNKTYMFYNGNNMGKSGFGYAELSGEFE